MAHPNRALIAALTATTFLTSTWIWAASQSIPAQPTIQQTPAAKDFGKLSADGSRAFHDLVLARIAIFDGRINDAKAFVGEADQSFAQAKTNEMVFTKDAADLKSPGGPSDRAIGSGRSASATDQMRTPIAWLPVNGTITINEDYTADPAKTAAVADANTSLKSGDHKAAMEKLQLAGLDVDMTLDVVPLEQTINDVHQAAELINSGKYYEGSQILRQVQESERFDVADIHAVPKASIASVLAVKH
jgi:hypothetical protein